MSIATTREVLVLSAYLYFSSFSLLYQVFFPFPRLSILLPHYIVAYSKCCKQLNALAWNQTEIFTTSAPLNICRTVICHIYWNFPLQWFIYFIFVGWWNEIWCERLLVCMNTYVSFFFAGLLICKRDISSYFVNYISLLISSLKK